MTSFFIAVFPYIVCALLLASLGIALPRYFLRALRIRPKGAFLRFALRSEARTSCGKIGFLRLLALTCLAFALSRAAIWLIGLIGHALKGNTEQYFWNQGYIWNQWDAPHYLGIAENGYVTTGDARLHLVFYPLYPMLVRFISFALPNTLISAYVASNVCLIFSGVMLFRLTELSYGEQNARRSLWLFMFCPAGAFFSIPYTESLFFLLTLSSVYCARKRRFFAAILLGALSSFTRMPGVICAVPIFYEMLRVDSKRPQTRKRAVLRAVGRFASCSCVLLGFAAYLLVNELVSGNPFQFLIYQRENWGQSAGNVFDTARYSIGYLFYPNVEWYRWGVWIPQCAFLLLIPLLLCLGARRLRPADLAYALVYFAVTVSPTMLISGPRYLCAMYPLYPLLSAFPKKKSLRAIAYALYAIIAVYCCWMYAVEYILL